MPAHFGLDIGSFSIKAVKLEKKGSNYKLAGFSEIKTPANLSSHAENDKKLIVNAIKKLLTEIKSNTKEIALSLSENSVFSQVIELPHLSETELASAINFEAEQYVPVPLNEVELEYSIISSTQGGSNRKMDVLLVAAKKSAVAQIVDLTETAGLTPIVLETEVLSLVRTVNFLFKKSCLILDLGHSSTNIILLEDENLKFTRNLKTGGEAFTRAIARELNMEFIQAEQYKLAYGINGAVLEGKVAKAILPTLNVVLKEVKKALSFFLQKSAQSKITTLIVSGGGSLMPGINSYLAEFLNLEVVTLDPFTSLIHDKKEIEIKGKARFSTAVGLAMREE